MKAYLTWGVGFGKGKILAQTNAQLDASLDKIKIKKLEKLEIPKCEIIKNKKELAKLRGDFSGIVLQNCAKGEVAASLVLGLAEDKIIIGHGKAGSLAKAERIAEYEVKKAINEQSSGLDYHIASVAPSKKGEYGCAIVALVLVDGK